MRNCLFHIRWVGLRGGYTETGDLKKISGTYKNSEEKKKVLMKPVS